VNIAFLTQFTHELGLHIIKVIECQFLRNFRRGRQIDPIRGSVIEALETRRIDRLANRLAAEAAKMLLLAFDLSHNLIIGGYWKIAVEAAV
jgi:hypothetical protein